MNEIYVESKLAIDKLLHDVAILQDEKSSVSDDFIYFCTHGKYPDKDEIESMYDIVLVFTYWGN
jgi:hypothetical protein